jgi:UrcA family protein
MDTNTRSRALGLSMIATMLVAPAPLFAAAQGDALTGSVRLASLNRAPDTGAEARSVKRRLATAALDVCGAPSSSLRTVKRGVARSDCYRRAYTQAAAQVRWPGEQRDGSVAPN